MREILSQYSTLGRLTAETLNEEVATPSLNIRHLGSVRRIRIKGSRGALYLPSISHFSEASLSAALYIQ